MRDFQASHHHHCYCSMPTALIWCQTCLGLHFWVCISISGFGSLFVFGFMCQMSREHLRRPTSSTTTIGDANIGGHQSLSFSLSLSLSLSLSFGLVLGLFGFWSIYGLGFLMWYKDLVIFDLGLKWGLGMIICRFVGTFWFRVCLKMVLIGDFVSVCIWICVWLVI